MCVSLSLAQASQIEITWLQVSRMHWVGEGCGAESVVVVVAVAVVARKETETIPRVILCRCVMSHFARKRIANFRNQ